MQWKINFTRVICLCMGKTTKAKPFQVNLKSPFPRIHYYQNKRLQVNESQCLIPTYSWTLTPIPNWTCSVMTISPFQCTDPSTRLNHQLEKDVGCKVLQFITWWRSRSSLVIKPYGVKTQQLLQEKDELGHMSSVHNMLVKNFCIDVN